MENTLLGSAKFGVRGGGILPSGTSKELIFGNCIDLNIGGCHTCGVVKLFPKRHNITVAPTRSGKGVSFIIPNLLAYAGSCLVIDPKGENAWITAPYRRSIGQKVVILDPWNEVNRRYGKKAGYLETISHFNPLAGLNPANDNYADDLAFIADALIINSGKDPHWDDSARELVAGLMSYLIETDAGTASLVLMRALLTKGADELAGLANEVIENKERFGLNSLAARKLSRFAKDNREIAAIISTALTQTAFLDSETLSKNLSQSDFSFSDIENGATIYLVLPVDKLHTYGRWLRLLVSIGIKTVARITKKLPSPCLFILDEFGTIGKLSAVAQAFGLMAGLQMSLWAFVQDLNQLKRDYPDDWETFLANSEAVTYLNIMDQTTAQYLSATLGVQTVEQISVATANERDKQRKEGKSPDYAKMTDKVFKRELMMPDEVRRTQQHIAYFTGRHNPLMISVFYYYESPFFLFRARLDPHYEGTIEKAEKWMCEMALPNWATTKLFLQALGVKIEDGEGEQVFCIGKGQTEKKETTKAAVIDWGRDVYIHMKRKERQTGQESPKVEFFEYTEPPQYNRMRGFIEKRKEKWGGAFKKVRVFFDEVKQDIKEEWEKKNKGAKPQEKAAPIDLRAFIKPQEKKNVIEPPEKASGTYNNF